MRHGERYSIYRNDVECTGCVAKPRKGIAPEIKDKAEELVRSGVKRAKIAEALRKEVVDSIRMPSDSQISNLRKLILIMYYIQHFKICIFESVFVNNNR